MTVQGCVKCMCPIYWDKLLNPPNDTTRAKDGKMGWWKEDLSKQIHSLDRCKAFMTSKEFKVSQTEQTNPNVQTAPNPLQVKEMSVTDFAEPAMRKEIQNALKIIKIREEEVIKFIGTDAAPAKIGMWMKEVREEMKK